jgi:hypothetical protein
MPLAITFRAVGAWDVAGSQPGAMPLAFTFRAVGAFGYQ